MAGRIPPQLAPRLPPTPPPVRIGRRDLGREMRPQPRLGLPLLPLLSAVLLLLALVQVGYWLWVPRERNVLRPILEWWDTVEVPRGQLALQSAAEGQDGAPTNDLMPAVSVVRQGAEAMRGNINGSINDTAAVRRVLLATEPENVQFGSATAGVVLTVLSDPACGPCRATMRQWQAAAAQSGQLVRVVYKFWPRDAAQTTGGLALELARREGRVAEFWRLLNAREDDLTDAELLVLLEQAGVPLGVQREALGVMAATAQLPGILERDIEQIAALELGAPPVALLNGYVLNETLLEPANLSRAIGRLARGQALGAGIWLMER